MKKLLTAVLLLSMMMNSAMAQKYQPNWASLDTRPVPDWWKDAKFGIFIHWGVYSVPAYAPVNEVDGVYEKYAEHYLNRLLTGNKLFSEHHKRYYGNNFTYQDFAPMFKASYFNPDDWASLLQRSGAKYVVLTSKHHDGFCLWPSKQSPQWNSVDIGPHRDLLGDLTTAVKKKGLHMGYYYSLLEWQHPLYTPLSIDNWAENHIIPQLQDLVTNYRPEIIFADGEWDYTSDKLKSEKFLAWLYNESPVKETVVVNDRWGKETRSKHGGYYTTEYDLVHDKKGIGAVASHPWEESRGIGTSYGYNKFETDQYYSSKKLIDLLVDKVSHGGNLLLNIGPDADGLIPVVMQERLLDIGAWLKVNGDAIYGTTVWTNAPEDTKQNDICYTVKGNNLYAILKKWPKGPVIINGVSGKAKVNMLGCDQKIKTTSRQNSITIYPPVYNPDEMQSNWVWVFKVSNFNL
ncbi:alpha-L-fucosidase [Mucilaginibacter sp. AW1-3]